MFAWIASKFGKWITAAGAVVLAIAAALFYGWNRGEKTGAAKGEADAEQTKAQAAQQRAAVAASDQQAQQAAVDSANEATDDVSKLPDAPAQQVGTAGDGTAAGELRDDGWTR